MNIKEQFEMLHYYKENKNFPILVEAIIEKKDELIPVLLDYLQTILDEGYEEKESYAPNYIGDVVALFLLAEFKEVKAFPIIIKLLEMETEDLEDFYEGIVDGMLPKILHSVFDGNVQALHKIIENETINEFVRADALETLELCVLSKTIDKQEFHDYCQKLFETLTHDENDIWSYLSMICINLDFKDLIKNIEKILEEGIVSKDFFGLIETLKDEEHDEDIYHNILLENKQPLYIESALQYLEEFYFVVIDEDDLLV